MTKETPHEQKPSVLWLIKIVSPILMGALGFASNPHAQENPARRALIISLITPCVGCHGENGVSQIPGIPSLAGQNAHYLLEELEEFQKEIRPSPIMGPMAKSLPRDSLIEIANYFASQPYVRPPQEFDQEKALKGKKIYETVCRICHLNGGREAGYAEYPLIAGQDLSSMRKSIDEILNGHRTSNFFMREWVSSTPRESIEDALHFFASQHNDTDRVQPTKIHENSKKRRKNQSRSGESP